MNKAYRLIWSKAKDAWVIVAEIVKGNGGPPPLTVSAVMVAAAMALAAGRAQALPVAPTVVNGTVGFSTVGNTLTVTNSPNSIINWQAFSIAAGETTRFNQQSALSAVLNRVTGVDPSQILGTLSSNGKVFLINPNGIIFGQGSRVDVAGLVASSLGISNQDFLAGNYRFSAGSTAGAVKNQGEITTTTGGMVWLISPNVENSGVITAPNGSVMLAAGQSVNMVDPQRPEIAVVVSAPADQAVNMGTILTQGGSAGIFGSLVNQQGVVSATSAVAGENGRIFLKSTGGTTLTAGSLTSANGVNGGSVTVQSTTGDTLVSGSVSASGSTGTGGTVQILGNRVALTGATVDASGDTGGGTVLVGGDYQGKNRAVQKAKATYVSKNSIITANALFKGDGGKVVVWSDGSTKAYGTLTARGGVQGGNGGLIETSGHFLDVRGIKVDASAIKGKAGNWLLDPYNVEIVGTASSSGGFDAGTPDLWTPTATTSTVYASDITNRLDGIGYTSTDVTISTTHATGLEPGDITVSAPVTWTSAAHLTLQADNNIGINAAISGASGTLTLDAPGSTTQTAPITAAKLELLRGNFTLTNPGNTIGTLAAGVDAATKNIGDIAIRNSQALIIGSVGSSSGISTNGTVSIDALGTTTQTAPITAANLELLRGNFTLTNAENAIGTLAAGNAATPTTVGNITLVNNRGLTIGTVGSSVGINSTGNVNLTATGQAGQDGIVVNDQITAASVTLNGTGGAGYSYNCYNNNCQGQQGGNGVSVNAAITATAGDISITGTGGTGGYANSNNTSGNFYASGGNGGTGINISGGGAISASGNVTLNGTGGDGNYARIAGSYGGYVNGGNGGHGVYVNAPVTSGGFTSITGTGGKGGYAYASYSSGSYIVRGGNGGKGIYISGAGSISASGNVTLLGTGGDGGYAKVATSNGAYVYGGNGGDGAYINAPITSGALTSVTGNGGYGGSAKGGSAPYSGYAGQGFGGYGGSGIILNSDITSAGAITIAGTGRNGGDGTDGFGGVSGGYAYAVGGAGGHGFVFNSGTISGDSTISITGYGGEGGKALGSDVRAWAGLYGGDAKGGRGGDGIRIEGNTLIKTTGASIALYGYGGHGGDAKGGSGGDSYYAGSNYGKGGFGKGGNGGFGISLRGTIGTNLATHSVYLRGEGGNGGYGRGGNGGYSEMSYGGKGGNGLGGDGGHGVDVEGGSILTNSGGITLIGYGGASGYGYGGSGGGSSNQNWLGYGGKGGQDLNNYNTSYSGHGLLFNSATIKSYGNGTIDLYGKGGTARKAVGGNAYYTSSGSASSGGAAYGGNGGDGIHMTAGVLYTAGNIILKGVGGNGGQADGGKSYGNGFAGNARGGYGGAGVYMNSRLASTGGYVSITGTGGNGGKGTGGDAYYASGYAGQGFGGNGGTGVYMRSTVAGAYGISSFGNTTIVAAGGKGGDGVDSYGGFQDHAPANAGNGGDGFRFDSFGYNASISAGGNVTITGTGGNGGEAIGSNSWPGSSNHRGGSANGGDAGYGILIGFGKTVETTGAAKTVTLTGTAGTGGKATGGFSAGGYTGGYATGGEGAHGIALYGQVRNENAGGTVALVGIGTNGGDAIAGSSFAGNAGYGRAGSAGSGVFASNYSYIISGGALSVTGSGGLGGVATGYTYASGSNAPGVNIITQYSRFQGTNPTIISTGGLSFNHTGNSNAIAGTLSLTNNGSGDIAYSAYGGGISLALANNAAGGGVTLSATLDALDVPVITTNNGAVNINGASDVNFVGAVNAGTGSVSVNSGGAINGQSGVSSITAGSATLSAVNGIGTATPFVMTVGSLSATNTNPGIPGSPGTITPLDISISNTGPLTVNGVTNNAGSITLDNVGAVTVAGNVEALSGIAEGLLTNSNVNIAAHSPLTINPGVIINAAGSVGLLAGASGSVLDNLLVGGNVTAQNANILLQAGNTVTVTGTLLAPNGIITIQENMNPPVVVPALTSQMAALLPGVNEIITVMDRESTDMTEEKKDEETTGEGGQNGTEFKSLPYCN